MFNRPSSRLLTVLVLAAAAALAGCQHRAATINSPESSTDNFQKAKAAGVRPLAVGEFNSKGDRRDVEARYLKDTLSTELSGAGLLDPASNAVVEGELISVSIGGSGGNATARFIITLSNGRVVYDRELRTTVQWSGGGAVANQRREIYQKLVGQLFTDPSFKNAVPR
ncbi:MAG: hypothetical protein RLZZ618_776 [Pseudomonadota bacterium]|jgi:hypothetical protein